jgi:glycosyltransferase involved in cell wall biosynthesis
MAKLTTLNKRVRHRGKNADGNVTVSQEWAMSPSGTAFEPAGGPLITIAIPTFNRAELLKGCIQSALSQTYENIEILVSDNASTDDTAKVLRDFNDKRLRAVRQETNVGLLPNWNACLAAAGGEYVVFVSDDDRISPWFVERCVDVIGKQSQVPIVVALSNFHICSSGHTKPARTSKHIGSGLRNGIDVLLEYLTDKTTVAMCSVMMRTEVLRSRGGIPLDLPHTADVATWAPLLFEGKVGFVNEGCATAYFHKSSETARLSVAQVVSDGGKMANLISRLAEERIKVASLRQELKLQAKRCFARRALVCLADHRSAGVSLLEIFKFLWRLRGDLMIANKSSVLRFAAIMLCPKPIAERLRYLRRAFQEGWHERQTAVKPG